MVDAFPHTASGAAASVSVTQSRISADPGAGRAGNSCAATATCHRRSCPGSSSEVGTCIRVFATPAVFSPSSDPGSPLSWRCPRSPASCRRRRCADGSSARQLTRACYLRAPLHHPSSDCASKLWSRRDDLWFSARSVPSGSLRCGSGGRERRAWRVPGVVRSSRRNRGAWTTRTRASSSGSHRTRRPLPSTARTTKCRYPARQADKPTPGHEAMIRW